jgi:glutamate formiminotransferase/formiminotetrahydrofolate cyclodeaminase
MQGLDIHFNPGCINMKIVECVPNFSEGRDRSKIKMITDEIESVKGITLLDVDPGAATNRTVVTFVGDPDAVCEAGFRAIRKASEVIDMRIHHGEHPRIGATDVCPFVPVSGVTMEDCVEIARTLGERAGRELGIPVYLYEHAASSPERKNLAYIRQGEYEGLAGKLKDPVFRPDFGPSEFSEHVGKTGATVIGAREFLIAWNLNLNTVEIPLANKIAFHLREKGSMKRDAEGNKVLDKDGNPVMMPGVFRTLKGVGWYIDEYRISQVSLNVTNYKETPLHLIMEEARKKAQEIGVVITGSELVGLIPKDALLMAGRFYLEKQGKSSGVPEEDLIAVAVKSLGLSDLKPFDIREKVIDCRVKTGEPPLISMKLKDFIHELSRESPAPGGGTAAALSGALGGALSSMVSALTVKKKEYSSVKDEMIKQGTAVQHVMKELVDAIDRDTDAFNSVMACFKMPRNTAQEKDLREKALEQANKEATLIPFKVMENSMKCMEIASEVIRKGNRNSLSDAGVSSLMCEAAVKGAFYNVLINCASIKDREFVGKITGKAKEIVEGCEKLSRENDEFMRKELIK